MNRDEALAALDRVRHAGAASLQALVQAEVLLETMAWRGLLPDRIEAAVSGGVLLTWSRPGALVSLLVANSGRLYEAQAGDAPRPGEQEIETSEALLSDLAQFRKEHRCTSKLV